MELQNNKFVRSIRDSLLHWFSEATEMFFSKEILCEITQYKTVELFLLTLGGGDEDYRKWLESASSAAPCPALIRNELSCFTDKKTEAPERQRGSLKSQSDLWLSWDRKPDCCLPCNTQTHVQLQVQLVYTVMWVAAIWRNTSFAAPRTSQVSMRNGNNWLFHLWPVPRQPDTYTSPTSPSPVLATGSGSEVTGQVEGGGLGMPRGLGRQP